MIITIRKLVIMAVATGALDDLTPAMVLSLNRDILKPIHINSQNTENYTALEKESGNTPLGYFAFPGAPLAVFSGVSAEF